MLKKMCPFLLVVLLAIGCSNNSNKKMRLYVTPYYNSQPLTINVGEYSQQLKTNNPKQLLKLSEEIRKKVDEVNIETLYVLAIRLYDAGEKEEAAYWYYMAQFRKNVFIQMQDGESGGLGNAAFEIPHALQSFNELSGKWINGYIGGYPEKWAEIIRQVSNDVAQMGYIQKSYPTLRFKPEEEQAAIVNEGIAVSEERVQWILENKDDILRQRKENGIEGTH